MHTPKHIRQSMAFRLFLLILGVQFVILAALAVATITVHHTQLRDLVLLSATRVSDVLIRSTQHSMLQNNRNGVQEIISAVGREPGIDGIRVFNTRGEVAFAAAPSDFTIHEGWQGETCSPCHESDGSATADRSRDRVMRTLQNAGGGRALSLVSTIMNAPDCSDAACHAHPSGARVLGVMEVRMSLADVDDSLRRSRNQLIALSLGAALLVGLVSGGFIWRYVGRPVRRLSEGMELASTGSLDSRLDVGSTDEIGQLSRTFNRMMEDLKRARTEITGWSDTLEARVREKTAELEHAHEQMLEIEKQASLGNLASSVAHELNNPLEGILTFARLSVRRIGKLGLPPEIARPLCDDLDLVADEAQRCGSIVQNLLLFSRQRPAAFQAARLTPVLHRCRQLVQHYAEMHHVLLEVETRGDDALVCDPGQIQQVLIALMVNAIEAMSATPASPAGGVLRVDVAGGDPDGMITIRIRDTGVGMSEETRAHLFEPFYTTKERGKGVGLGLAIARAIVDRHHGQIAVDTDDGKGSTFTLTLPRTQCAPSPPGPEALEGSRQ